MIKNKFVAFLVCALCILPSVGMAAGIGSTTIGDVSLKQSEHELEVAFSIQNSSDAKKDITYGIRLQDKDGNNPHEVPSGDVSLKVGESRVLYTTFLLPTGIIGHQDVFLLSRDENGLVSVLKYLGSVTIEAVDTEVAVGATAKQVRLGECVTDLSEQIVCGVINTGNFTNVDVNYIINKGSAYGPEVTAGVVSSVPVTGDRVTIPFSDSIVGGYYTYRLWLDNKADTQQIMVSIEGEGNMVTGVDTAGNGALNIWSQVKENGVQIIVVAVPILLFIVLLYLALRKPKALLLAVSSIGLSSVGIVMAAVVLDDIIDPSVAHIFNGLSQDSGDEQFGITLDSTEFQDTEEIGFSVVFQDVALPNDKPSGGSIDINVDGGAWSTLVAISDTNSIYHKTVSAIATAGTHTINFRSPDLCGGVFGESFFGNGIFGTTDCLFSIDVEVVHNDPPSTPNIGGSCVLGEPCNVGVVSTDTDGGQLCYEAEWPNNVTESIGCATQGTPVTAQYTLTACTVAGTTIQARATDASSESSSWGTAHIGVPGTIVCTEPCSHCTYDGVIGDLSMSVVPPFIPPSGISEVRWSLTNVATCSMVSSDVETGAARGGPWDWDFIRQNNSMDTIVLESPTKYTMTCIDLDTNEDTASVIVNTVPAWQEF